MTTLDERVAEAISAAAGDGRLALKHALAGGVMLREHAERLEQDNASLRLAVQGAAIAHDMAKSETRTARAEAESLRHQLALEWARAEEMTANWRVAAGVSGLDIGSTRREPLHCPKCGSPRDATPPCRCAGEVRR